MNRKKISLHLKSNWLLCVSYAFTESSIHFNSQRIFTMSYFFNHIMSPVTFIDQRILSRGFLENKDTNNMPLEI